MSMQLLRRLVPAAAGFALLAAAVPARAQGGSSGSTGSSMVGGSTSPGTGGSGNSSSGSSGSSGTFLSSSGSLSSSILSSTTTNGGTSSRGGSTTTPGSTTFLGPSYGNVYGSGYSGLLSFAASSANPSVIKTSQFGTAMFTITPATTTTGTANFGSKSVNGVAVVQPTNAVTPIYGSTVGVRKVQSYVAEARFKAPTRNLEAMHADVSGAIARADRIESRAGIKVMLDGGVVVLRGTVADKDERNAVEDLVRLTAGVNDVRNELVVRTAE